MSSSLPDLAHFSLSSALVHRGCKHLLLLSALLLGSFYYLPSVHAQELRVELVSSKDPVEPNQTFVYTMNVINSGSEPSEQQDFSMILDSKLDFLNATRGGGERNRKITWGRQVIPGNTTRAYNVNVRLQSDASSDDDIVTTAFAGNGFAEITTEIEGGGNNEEDQDLDVSIEANKSRVEPGENVTYTITLENKSGQRATGVDFSVTLDKELIFRDASGGGVERRGVVRFDDLSIAPRDTRKFSITVEVKDRTEDEDVIVSSVFLNGKVSEVEFTVNDEDVDDNDEDRDIVATVQASSRALEPDETFTYTISLRNKGDSRVNNIEVEFELDDRLEFLSASNRGNESGGKIVWDEINIDSGRTRTLTASVRVSDRAEDGDRLESTVIAEGSVQTDILRVEDRNRGFEDVRLHAFTEQDDVEPGEEITYTFRIENRERNEESIDVVALLDPIMRFSSASDDGLQYERQTVKWEDVFIPQNDTKTLTLRVVLDEDTRTSRPARLIVHAGLSSRQVLTHVAVPGSPIAAPIAGPAEYRQQHTGLFVIDPQGIMQQPVAQPAPAPARRTYAPPPPSQPRKTYAPAPTQSAAFAVHKEANQSEVQPGSVLTYTISVRNTSNVRAEDILVRDLFPAGSLEILDAGDGTVGDGTIEWELPSLDAGSSWSVSYQARASENLWHGQSIDTAVEVLHDSVPGNSTVTDTGVVSMLPQTGGFGAYSLAFHEGSKRLQANSPFVRYKAQEQAVEAPAEPFRPTAIFWFLIVSTGLTLGAAVAGLRFFRR